jgi:exodeoxyribonuclease VIII
MRLGTLTHAMILEPDTFKDEFAVMPKFDRRTTVGKKAAEEFEQEHAGKIIVDETAYEKASSIAASVRKHPVAIEGLRDGNPEVSLFWDQYGLPCKARCDYMTGSAIFDIKTCSDASPDGFAKQIASFQYHVQAAHYAAGFREIVGWDLDRFVFIAVESEAPYAVGVYTLDARSLQSGRLLMERAARAYRVALEQADTAPAFYSDTIAEISVPAWAQVEPYAE